MRRFNSSLRWLTTGLCLGMTLTWTCVPGSACGDVHGETRNGGAPAPPTPTAEDLEDYEHGLMTFDTRAFGPGADLDGVAYWLDSTVMDVGVCFGVNDRDQDFLLEVLHARRVRTDSVAPESELVCHFILGVIEGDVGRSGFGGYAISALSVDGWEHQLAYVFSIEPRDLATLEASRAIDEAEAQEGVEASTGDGAIAGHQHMTSPDTEVIYSLPVQPQPLCRCPNGDIATPDLAYQEEVEDIRRDRRIDKEAAANELDACIALYCGAMFLISLACAYTTGPLTAGLSVAACMKLGMGAVAIEAAACFFVYNGAVRSADARYRHGLSTACAKLILRGGCST